MLSLPPPYSRSVGQNMSFHIYSRSKYGCSCVHGFFLPNLPSRFVRIHTLPNRSKQTMSRSPKQWISYPNIACRHVHTHPCTHTITQSPTHTPIPSLAHTSMYPYHYSLTHPCTRTITRSPIHGPITSLGHPSMHPYHYSVTHPCTQTIIRSAERPSPGLVESAVATCRKTLYR